MPMINCPDCQKEMSDAASACPNCGRPNSAGTAALQRSVSPLLGVGIFLAPVIFAWFTLRQGHTGKARAISFGWMVFALAVFVADPQEGAAPGSSASSSSEANNDPESVAQAEQQSGPPANWVALDKTVGMQAKRLELMDGLKEHGVIIKVETPTDMYPRIYVGDAWHTITIDDKENFANSILTYYYAQNPEVNSAIIRDGYTGEDIGSYSYQHGLSLD